MLTKSILFILVISLSFLCLMISTILAIVNRKNRTRRNSFIFITIVFSVITLCTASYISYKTFLFAKNKTSQLVQNTEDFGKDFVDALGEHLAARYMDTPYLDSLKNIQPETISIPPSYFYCAGFRDYYRMPLVYPYSIIAIDSIDKGCLSDETGINNIFNESNSSKEVINNIIKFVFSKEYLMAETDEESFILLNFENGNIQKFESKDELHKYLNKQNIVLPDTMMTITQYYSLFR